MNTRSFCAALLITAVIMVPAAGCNTTDLRCLSDAGVLRFSCSVWSLQSVFQAVPSGFGHGFCPRVAAGVARGSTVRGPGGRGGSSFPDGFRSWRRVMRSRERIR